MKKCPYIASRLRAKGWLLATAQRGVWEFVPAAVAGSYSSSDPLLPLKSFILKHPDARCALAQQSAAWALGLADRVPATIEVVFEKNINTAWVTVGMAVSIFNSNLPYTQRKGIPVLGVEGIVVHMAAKPSAVRSWASALEWLPGVSAELEADRLLKELDERPQAVISRTGYLLQGLRPDLSKAIYEKYIPKAKTRFGQRSTAIRNNEYWKISDTLLPFDPKELEAIR